MTEKINDIEINGEAVKTETLSENTKKIILTEEDLENVKLKEFHKYEIAESILKDTGNTVSIMALQLEALIFEKMYLLFEKYRVAENNLETAKIDLQMAKDKLLLETDFKKELDESRPTVAMKEAYMRQLLSDYENKVDACSAEAVFYKDKLQIVNDLIKKERLLLKLEGDLKQ